MSRYHGSSLKIDWNDESLMSRIADILDEVTGNAAELAFRTADSLVPVDTGELRNSLEVSKSKYKNGGHIVFSRIRTKDEAIKFNSIEFGKVTPNGTYVPPQPFMRPAIRRVRRVLRNNMQDAINRSI
jgi:HK97 gp10 family phage protein